MEGDKKEKKKKSGKGPVEFDKEKFYKIGLDEKTVNTFKD